MKSKKKFLIICILLINSLFPYCSLSVESKPAIFEESGIEEKIGETLPLDVKIKLSTGKETTLKDLINDYQTPIVLNFVYYHCPMLCNLLADGIATVIKEIDNKTQKNMTILTISMDPDNTLEQAKNFSNKYTKDLGEHPKWLFATASSENIKILTQKTGFKYTKLQNNEDFAHSAALIVSTKKGVINRYLYGIQFKAFDLKMALIESKSSQNQNILERTLLFCYQYNPDENSYAMEAMRVMQITGTIFAFLILLSIIIMLKKEKT